MRAADAVPPNLAYPSEKLLPTTDIKPLARSKCCRRPRGAPPCRRHARGGGRFLVLLPVRALNRTVIVLELIVTFADTFPNQSKMSGQIQNQGVQSLCTGTNYRKYLRFDLCRSMTQKTFLLP